MAAQGLGQVHWECHLAGVWATCGLPVSPEKTHLLPGHGHVLQQLVHCVGHKLECSQVYTLIMPEFAGGHVAMVLQQGSQCLSGMGHSWQAQLSCSDCCKAVAFPWVDNTIDSP